MKPQNGKEAAGRLALGIRRVVGKYPLFGALLGSLQLCPDASLETMGVGMGSAKIELYYNPEFVCRISLPELAGVLHHEARHILYGHVFSKPEDLPDENARIIAEEVTVNERLPEPLPGRPILLEDYPDLPPDETTAERYARLAGKTGGPQNGNPPSDSDSSNAGGGQENDGRQRATDPSGDDPSSGSPSAAPADDHSRWNSLRENENLAKAQIAAAANAALQSGRTLSAVEQQLQEMLSASFGLNPGGAQSELTPSATPESVSWRRILRQFVARARAPAFSFTMPSRRMPDLLGIVPGKSRRNGRVRVLAAIDTSGSMTDDLLSAVARELTYLSKRAEITIVEFDAKIQRIYRYRGMIKEVIGRGGTDFIPVLDPEFLDAQRPDVICIFTDGDGSAPDLAPAYPLLWVLVPYGEPPVSWGTVARMEPSPQNR